MQISMGLISARRPLGQARGPVPRLGRGRCRNSMWNGLRRWLQRQGQPTAQVDANLVAGYPKCPASGASASLSGAGAAFPFLVLQSGSTSTARSAT
jgi:hypothetical protein